MGLSPGACAAARLQREGMFYLDRTFGIREVERLGQTLVFLRPRRFGKSLWLQTLATYYDLRLADDFEAFFGGLDAGKEPTPQRNRYFVLQWNFSAVSARGSVDEIARRLHVYVNHQIEDFLVTYEGRLPGPVKIENDATDTLRHLLTRIRQTPFRLCLLFDEYDNFVNEVMVQDAATYRALFEKDGPFKEVFKSVKSGAEGKGLERVFATGVSPVALNDLTSGFNNAKDVSHHPALATLFGPSRSRSWKPASPSKTCSPTTSARCSNSSSRASCRCSRTATAAPPRPAAAEERLSA